MEYPDKIPEYIRNVFRRHGINIEDIIISANADISIDEEYCDIWIALDDKKLAMLKGKDKKEKIKLFSGFKLKKNENMNKHEWMEQSFETFPLEDIESLKAENMVSTGVLTAKLHGEDKELCMFNRGNAKKIATFVKLFEKIKKDQKLTEEDLREDDDRAYCPKCGMLYPDPKRKICPRCMDKRSIFLRVLSFVPKYKKKISFIVLCMFFNVGLNLLSPYIGGSVLFDQVLIKGGRHYGQVGLIVLVIVISKAVAQIAGIFQGRVNSTLSAEVIFDLKTQVFDAMQHLSLSFYSKKETGNLMTRINGDAENLQSFFHDGFPYFIVNGTMIIGISIIMVTMNPKLALLVLIPAPVVVYYLKKMFPVLWRMYHKRYISNSKLNSHINDSLKGFRVVKAFGKESAEVNKFNKINQGVFSVDLGLGNLTNALFPFMWFIMGIGSLLVWGVGGYQVVKGELTFGTLVSFIGYIGMIYGPLQFMTQIVDWWSNCMNSAQRIFEIIDSVPDVANSPYAKRMPNIKGGLEFKNVSFSYEPNKPVLNNISFKVNPGEMLGIVGHSGAGKSTIANLIDRLYDADEGGVYIDGVNIKDIDLKDLRGQIGMVSQESFLFMGSIAENIAYAKPDATMDEIVYAARAANAHDFIMEFPDGYDTIIGKAGRDLSGGEKQRISIARAILHNPRILILDEATASVDTETEGKIQESLERLVEGRTTISIAHRLSTLRNADKLVVVENGKIIESGTHIELINKKGTYYKMVQKQSEALKLRGVGD